VKALVLGGGSHGHEFEATTAALVATLTRHGLAPTVVTEPDDAWQALAVNDFDLFAVNALRFRMKHERYDHLREKWRYDTPGLADEALERHLAHGGAILAMHTSIICFDDFPLWSETLGRRWSWEPDALSWHPDLGPITIDPVGSAAFSVTDERYTDLIDLAAFEPLATCDGEVIAWRRQQGSSRIGVDTLGHDVEGYSHPAHAALLDSIVDWLVFAQMREAAQIQPDSG
jgi:uncharacterized protein